MEPAYWKDTIHKSCAILDSSTSHLHDDFQQLCSDGNYGDMRSTADGHGSAAPQKSGSRSFRQSCSHSRDYITEDLLFYCTEELGSESTSGVWDEAVCSTHYISHSCMRQHHNHHHHLAPPFSSPPALLHIPPCTTARCTVPISHLPSPAALLPLLPASTGQHTIPMPAAPSMPPLPRIRRCYAQHAFPPPISSLLSDRPLMKSIKFGDRFILKKVTNVSRSLFRATRKDGRLMLELAIDHDGDSQPNMVCLPPTLQLEEETTYPKWKLNILSPKPSLNLKTLSHNVQALAMLMHSCDSYPQLVEDPPPSPHPITNNHGTTKVHGHIMDMTTPHVFAVVLNLLSIGMSIVTIKFGHQAYGVYLLKSSSFSSKRESFGFLRDLPSNNSCLEVSKNSHFPSQTQRGVGVFF